MRIGINLLAVSPSISGGIEFYINNLLESLFVIDNKNFYILFTNRDNYHQYNYCRHNVESILCDVNIYPKWKRVVWEQIKLPLLVKSWRLDLLHSPTYTLPVLSNVPGLVSILDMLYCVHPEFINKGKVNYWRLFVPLSAKKSRKILTISNSSKKDIIHYLKVPPEKVISTPLAIDNSLKYIAQPADIDINAICSKYKLREPYILYVGGVGKHKNPIVLIKALRILRERVNTKNLMLVITGNDYGSAEEIMKYAVSVGLEKEVCLPGYVARNDLPALYAGALAYVSPSLFEGFGFTVLEAMAFRSPVIVSDRASLPEVAGDAALIVDPGRPDHIADAVSRIVSEPELREELIRRGCKRVREFSWERTAKLTLEAYREAAHFRYSP